MVNRCLRGSPRWRIAAPTTFDCVEVGTNCVSTAQVGAEAKRRLPAWTTFGFAEVGTNFVRRRACNAARSQCFQDFLSKIMETVSLHLRGRGTTKWWKEFLHPHHTAKLPFIEPFLMPRSVFDLGSRLRGANAVSADFDAVERRRSRYFAAGLTRWTRKRKLRPLW